MAATTFPSRVPPITIYEGDTTTWPTYIFKDAAGAVIDLSSYSWAAQYRATPDASTYITLAVDTTAAATGQITVSATAADTATMTTNGVWDLQSTKAGAVRTWIYGQILVTKDVTRLA